MDARRVQPVEEVEVVHRHVADVAHPGRIVRCAEAWMFRHHDLVRLRQVHEERRPLRQAGGTMQVDEQWPLAVAPHAHADVADLVPVLVHSLLMLAILNSVGWAKARERRAFNACCIFDRAVPTRAALHKEDRVGTARIARIILLMRRAMRAFAHPTAFHPVDSVPCPPASVVAREFTTLVVQDSKGEMPCGFTYCWRPCASARALRRPRTWIVPRSS